MEKTLLIINRDLNNDQNNRDNQFGYNHAAQLQSHLKLDCILKMKKFKTRIKEYLSSKCTNANIERCW